MRAHHLEWRGKADFQQKPEDAEYFRKHPPG